MHMKLKKRKEKGAKLSGKREEKGERGQRQKCQKGQPTTGANFRAHRGPIVLLPQQGPIGLGTRFNVTLLHS